MAQDVALLPKPPERSSPGSEGHPGSALVSFGSKDRDEANLTRSMDVRPTAGRPVVGANLDDPHRTLHVGRLSQWKTQRLLAGHDVGRHLAVLPYDRARPLLDRAQEILRRARMIDVDRHVGLAHVEGARIRRRKLDEGAGEDVLPRVLLHVVEAPGPIDRA